MFEYSLSNGKKQFEQGFYFLFATLIVGATMVLLLALFKDATAITVITIIFGIILAVLGILSLVKIIFGGVVYHAERIAFSKENSSFNETAEPVYKKRSSKKN